MQLFEISSPKLEGYITVVYNDELVKLDFTNAILARNVKAHFKAAIPTTLADFLLGKWCSAETVIIESSFNVVLEDFTRDYPYQRNSHLLPPIWDKMPLPDKIQAVQQAKPYRKYCDRNKHWYNPKIAAAWLKNKEYLNDWNKM